MSNNRLDKKLTVQNNRIMTNMVVYLKATRIPEYQVELIRQDLLDMTLSAQSRNQPLSDVFGDDYKSFCDEIIANTKRERRWVDVVRGGTYLFGGFAFLSLLNISNEGYYLRGFQQLVTKGSLHLNFPITLGFVLSTVLIFVEAVLILYLIGRFSFKTDAFLQRLHNLPSIAKLGIGALLMGTWLFGPPFWMKAFNNDVLLSVNFYVYLTILLILLIPTIALIVKNARAVRKGSKTGSKTGSNQLPG